jgi:hypothetical protein
MHTPGDDQQLAHCSVLQCRQGILRRGSDPDQERRALWGRGGACAPLAVRLALHNHAALCFQHLLHRMMRPLPDVRAVSCRQKDAVGGEEAGPASCVPLPRPPGCLMPVLGPLRSRDGPCTCSASTVAGQSLAVHSSPARTLSCELNGLKNLLALTWASWSPSGSQQPAARHAAT